LAPISITFSQKTDSVNCFIQLQDLWDLDLNRATIKADFYLTLEYKNLENKVMNLLNGSIIKVDTIFNNDSLKVLTLRLNVELRTHFDYYRFPLDSQKIIIEFEPNQYLEQLVLITNPNQNILVDSIHLNGWIVKSVKGISKINNYHIIENNVLKDYYYSSLHFEIPILRENRFSYFLKTFLPSLIAILIVYIGFILHSDKIEFRINLAVGSLFVMISNFIFTQRLLPNVSEFTLIEKINAVSLVIIFLTILFFAIIYSLQVHFPLRNWKPINRCYLILTTIVYTVFFVYLLL
jgi:cell division protein FtsL